METKPTDSQANLDAMRNLTQYRYDEIPEEKESFYMMTKEERIQSIEDAVRVILYAIGEDPEREGLVGTPNRVARMYIGELSTGYSGTLDEVFGSALFEEGHDEMVLVKNIPLFSLCEHHMVPYHGNAHVAYIPKNGMIVGISKLARLVEKASRRLTIQERLTSEIADSIERVLHPEGVMITIEAEHMCMCMRGVEKPGTKTTTSVVRGVFKYNDAARNEFLQLIKS